MKDLDIILPCYNPPQNWDNDIIERFFELKTEYQGKINFNLIVVNDGSSHDIADGVINLRQNIPSLLYIDNKVNKGKGFALKTGLSKSKCKYAMFTDIDFPYTHDSMVAIINDLIAEKASVIVGIRGDSYYDKIPEQRSFISKSLKTINKWLFKLPTSDTQGGLKAMDQKAKEIFINLKTNRYLIDLEFLKKVSQKNLSVQLIPVIIRDGVVLNKMPFKTLIKELGSFVKILFS